jgi:hypothetical protein
MKRLLARPVGAEGCKGTSRGCDAEGEDGRGGPAVSGGRVQQEKVKIQRRDPQYGRRHCGPRCSSEASPYSSPRTTAVKGLF